MSKIREDRDVRNTWSMEAGERLVTKANLVKRLKQDEEMKKWGA